MEMIKMLEKSIEKIVRERIKKGSRLEAENKSAGFFYSEDDFQISLIHEFEFQDHYKKDFIVYYEKNYIDILLESRTDKKRYPIELKYSNVYNKVDYGKKIYTIIKKLGEDINFIKNILFKKNVERGYCIVLANMKFCEKKYMEKLQPYATFDFPNNKLSGILKYKNKLDDVQINIAKANPCLIRYAEIENYQYLIIEISKDNFRDDK